MFFLYEAYGHSEVFSIQHNVLLQFEGLFVAKIVLKLSRQKSGKFPNTFPLVLVYRKVIPVRFDYGQLD